MATTHSVLTPDKLLVANIKDASDTGRQILKVDSAGALRWMIGAGEVNSVTLDGVEREASGGNVDLGRTPVLSPVRYSIREARPAYCAYFNQWTISDVDRRARYRQIASVRGGLTVLNIESGPGKPVNAVDIAASKELRQAGHIVLGYVKTRSGDYKISPDVIKTDIDTWLANYSLDGIFIDEGEANQDNADIGFYGDLRNYIKGKGDYIVAYNPGTHPHPDYYGIMDIIMVVEHNATTFLDPSLVPDLDENRRGPAQTWALVHTIPNRAMAIKVIERARQLGIHYLTLADTDTSETWHQLLPASWLFEQQANPLASVGNVTRVLHDGSAYPARPASAVYVDWYGPTKPASMAAGDSWTDSTA